VGVGLSGHFSPCHPFTLFNASQPIRAWPFGSRNSAHKIGIKNVIPNLPIIQGRGTAANVPNRFDKIELEPDGDHLDAEEAIAPATVFYRDSSRSIIATNDSPDVGFEKSINPYRGCEHGCIYC
jgi:hypothetical protein